MADKNNFDPGLTQQYIRSVSRTINDDGQFNVQRIGTTLHDKHPYLFLISAPLPVFIGVILGVFLAVNVMFAALYLAVGIEHLKGADDSTRGMAFLSAFFFSTHTLTTVGYGNVYPSGIAANTVSALEATVGLMGFAIATGLLFGRFSRPSARIGYSDHMIVAPYREGTSLQFRIVNRRSNNLLELTARVLLMTVDADENGRLRRQYTQLSLEREQVVFFPLAWTVVHPITPESPLWGKTAQDVAALQTEVLVSIKAFDETFGQVVNSRRSYRPDEIVWGARFTPAFDVSEEGDLRLEVSRVSSFEPAGLPESASAGGRTQGDEK